MHPATRLSTLVIFLLLATAVCPAHADTELVPPGAEWRYLDDGSDQGTLWTDVEFDDSDWATGPAQLGYGDGDEATVVSFGPDSNHKYTTTYFRHDFSTAGVSGFVALQLRLLRDDGAVVHLNGSEIYRSNMPAGAVADTTFAAGTVGGDQEDIFHSVLLDPEILVDGDNVLAVEIHQRSFTSSDISFDLELVGLTEVASPFRKAPRLIYGGVNTEMKVVWQLTWDVSATLAWGDDTSYDLGSVQTAEYGTRHQHAHIIDGLTPEQKYFYRVIAGQDTLTGSFQTAPLDEATAVKFLAYGDTRTYPAYHDQVAAAMLAAFQEDSAYQSMAILVGDLVTHGDSETDWQTEFFDPAYPNIQALLANVPVQACMGNHEESGVLFSAYFPYPFVDRRYWSFDYGPAHFAVVDQYTDYAPGSAQLAWLDNDLATTNKPWKFLVMHEPGWSAGGHDNNTAVQNVLWPLCLVHDVAMVFSGHNHYYARADVNTIQHITTGGGGAPLHAPNLSYPYVVTGAQAHHFCQVEIDGNQLTFTATTPTGVVIDAFTRSVPSAVDPSDDTSPPAVVLHPAYPNPFNATTTVDFSVPTRCSATLNIYDLAGQKVRTLVADGIAAGRHRIPWNGRDDAGRDLGSGLYLFSVQTDAGIGSGGRIMMVK